MLKKIDSKKAILFSIDATLAIILALSIILTSLFYLSQSHISFEKEGLYKITLDSLAVLEKNGVLSYTTITNTSDRMQVFLDSLPYNTCAKIELLTKENVKIKTVTKRDCTYSDEYIISRRVYSYQDEIYLAEMEAWYR